MQCINMIANSGVGLTNFPCNFECYNLTKCIIDMFWNVLWVGIEIIGIRLAWLLK